MSAKVIALRAIADEKNAYNFYMENTGQVMLQCKAHLELTNIATGKEYTLNRVEFSVFPAGSRKVKLTIPRNVRRFPEVFPKEHIPRLRCWILGKIPRLKPWKRQ